VEFFKLVYNNADKFKREIYILGIKNENSNKWSNALDIQTNLKYEDKAMRHFYDIQKQNATDRHRTRTIVTPKRKQNEIKGYQQHINNLSTIIEKEENNEQIEAEMQQLSRSRRPFSGGL